MVKNYTELLNAAYVPTFRTVYISHNVYNAIDPTVRKQLLKVLRKSDIIKRYVANVESDLRARGEHELADAFLGEIILQRIN